MDAAQEADFKNRLQSIEDDLLQRLDKMESANQSWARRNAPIIAPLISAAIVLVTIAVAWGRLEMAITSIRENGARLQLQIDQEESSIRLHHEDTAKHVDSAWKSDVRSDLNSIRELLIQHMAQNKASANNR